MYRPTARSRSTHVMVHGTDIATARAAVDATGMRLVTTYDKVGVAVAEGTADQIESARTEPGVTYLEGNTPIEYTLETSNTATRGAEAVSTLSGANGSPLDGTGVSVAVIDSGIDPTHPFFRNDDGSSAVVANLKSLCLDESTDSTDCVVKVPNAVDTDTVSGGGHGTHVSGIVAGRDTTLTDGTQLPGAAPGSSLVSISTGAVLFIIGADSARALVAEGVATVWAAGSDGGDGSESLTNPPGQDPTGGVLSVASYFDQASGTRDGNVSEYSSRGDSTDASTWPDISAPGEDIESACRPYLLICSTGLAPNDGPGLLDVGTFNTISGTSMGAPHIAGIVAQMFQADPTATPAAVEDALKSTAYQYTDGAAYSSAGGYTTSFDKGTGLDGLAPRGGARPFSRRLTR